MATRYRGPLVKKECEIYEIRFENYMYILAKLDNNYLLYQDNLIRTETDDALLLMINAHFGNYAHYAVINADIFNALLNSINAEDYRAAMCNHKLSPYYRSTHELEQSHAHKKAIISLMVEYCDGIVHPSAFETVLSFDVPSISLQPYKFIIAHSTVCGARTYLIRGVNAYKIRKYTRDCMLIEQDHAGLSMGLFTEIKPLFECLCRHANVDNYAEKFLMVRTYRQFAWCSQIVKSQDLAAVQQIFNIKTHEENYAESIRNLYDILKVPRVIFNIILEFL